MGMNVLDNYSVAFRFVERFCLWLSSQTEVIELDPAAVNRDEDVPYDYVCTIIPNVMVICFWHPYIVFRNRFLYRFMFVYMY